MLHHGIDLHKRSVVIGTADDTGKIIRTKRLRTRRVDILRYLQSMPGPHRATVETTTGWYWLSDLFREHGIDLILAHALRLRAISQAKVKTDSVDASTLAQLLWADLIPHAHMLDPELRPYRDLLRLRHRLVRRRVAAKCSIHSILEKYNQPAVERLPSLPFVEAGLHQDQIDLLTRQIKEIESVLNDILLPLPPVQRLLHLPGFGRRVAFTVALETGDASRFASDRNFTSYARLVPAAKNSAGRVRSQPSKQGNAFLKTAFMTAAVQAVRYEPTIKTWYQAKLRKKPKRVAQTLVAKELARIAFRILKDEVDFNGTFKGVPIEHPKPLRWPRRASPDA